MLSLSLSFAISVNCNFTNDMCYWSQSINDDFDWTFHAGSTSSTNTGPSADHTTGTRTGKLSKAYFESNLSSYYSSYVIDAHARLHPND